METPDTVLAFDFGTQRIGVAVGSTITRSARPLTTIDAPAGDARYAALARVIVQWQPDLLVVGLPVHADGSPHQMTARSRRFGEDLRERFQIPVASLRDWEHGRRMPDAATRAYLTVIEREPEAVQRALAGGRAA